MLPMTSDENKKKTYITNVQKEGENLITTYADKSTDTIPYSEHNLNVARMRMIDQARENIPFYHTFVAKEVASKLFKRYSAIILSLIGLFFLYNFDIHIIIKIILTILALLGNTLYYLYSKFIFIILGYGLEEVEATEFYINNLNDFLEYTESGEIRFLIPIEDIANNKLTKEMLEKLLESIQKYKSEGITPSEMRLTYKKVSKTDKQTSKMWYNIKTR